MVTYPRLVGVYFVIEYERVQEPARGILKECVRGRNRLSNETYNSIKDRNDKSRIVEAQTTI